MYIIRSLQGTVKLFLYLDISDEPMHNMIEVSTPRINLQRYIIYSYFCN